MKHNKYLVRLFMVLIFFTLSSVAYLILPDSPKIKKDLPVAPLLKTSEIAWDNTATNTILKKDEKAKPSNIADNGQVVSTSEKVANSGAITTAQEIKNPIITTVQILDKKYILQIEENSTVYDTMQQLVDEKQITATLKEFKGMGYFLEAINGINNDNQNNKYWIYYINGQSAKMGISSYILKNNDLITWKYEASKF